MIIISIEFMCAPFQRVYVKNVSNTQNSNIITITSSTPITECNKLSECINIYVETISCCVLPYQTNYGVELL